MSRLRDEPIASDGTYRPACAGRGAMASVRDFPMKSLPVSDFQTLMSRWIDRLGELGFATYLAPGQNVWGYTLKGALKVAFRTYCCGMRRVFWPDR